MTTTEILTGIKNWVTGKLTLKQDVINDLASIRSGAQAGATSVQPADILSYFDDAVYDSGTHRINFYHGQSVIAYVDASPFIVDGMVNDVRIENGYLVIDFNTDSGKQDISIPLTNIFNPNNYYNKTQTDELLAQKMDAIGIDDVPTTGSNNLVKSGGVQNELALGAVYDVSAKNPTGGPNNDGKWESLSALLSDTNLNTLIPTAYRKGGMSIKFVHTSDNKYVQYRYMGTSIANADFTNVSNWQGVDEEILLDSKNFVENKTIANKLKEYIPIKSLFDIRNGSQGNSANAWVVTLFRLFGSNQYAIPCSEGDSFKITVNKALPEGFNYYYRLVTYSTATPSSLNADKVRDLANGTGVDISTPIVIESGELGFSIQLTALDAKNAPQQTGRCVPLRVTDFNDGDIVITSAVDIIGDAVEDISELDGRVLDVEKEMYPSYKQGYITYNTPIDVTLEESTVCTNRFLVPVIGGHTITCHNKSIIPYSVPAYIMAYNNSGEKVNYDYQFGGGTAVKTVVLDANAVYLRFNMPAASVLESYVTDDTTGKVIWRGNSAILTRLENLETKEVNDYEQVTERVTVLEESIQSNLFIGASNNYVSTKINSLIPGRKYRVLLKDKNYDMTGVTVSAVKFGIYSYDSSNVSTKLIEKSTSSALDSYYDIIIPNDSKYIRVGGRATQDVSVYFNIIDITDFTELGTEVDSIEDQINGLANNEINVRNGSQGNTGNAWVITFYGKSTRAISVTPGHKYKLAINKQPEEGYTFFLAIDYYSTNNPSQLYNDIIRNNVNNASDWINIDDVFEAMEGEYGISIQVIEQIVKSQTQASPNTIALRTTDFANVSFAVIDVTDSILYNVSDFNTRVPELEKTAGNNIIGRNRDKIPMLVNACRYHKTSLSSKDFQALICADSHGMELANKNAIAATNGFETIDAYIHVGDIVGSYPQSSDVHVFKTNFGKLEKPGFIVVGNHDVGNSYLVAKGLTQKSVYLHFIKPMVDAGYLVSGEYTENIPYWYHDDINNKIRIIGLYEYDDPLDLDTEYWHPVEYDSSYPNVSRNTSYQVGDKVRGGYISGYTDIVTPYTDYAFECVQAVTTPANEYGQGDAHKFPSFKIFRGNRVIRQTQAQWFLDTLASTPADYGVLVITHNPFSDTAVSQNLKFSWPSNVQGSAWTQTNMATNFIKNAIAAFKAGSNYSEKVIMSGDAAYLNVLNDGSIDYAYEVSKNFSAKNSGVHLLGLLGGHCHRDVIWKDGDIYQISPNCAMVDSANDSGGDVRRTRTDDIATDSLTVASFASGRIGLVKIGVNVTDRGTFRDYEVIDTSV